MAGSVCAVPIEQRPRRLNLASNREEFNVFPFLELQRYFVKDILDGSVKV